jgi:hypothetical protein
MFASLITAARNSRHELGTLTCDSINEISGDEAISLLNELGHTRRVLDFVIAAATGRVHETEAHRGRGDRSAAESCAKALRSSAHAGHITLNAGRALQHDEIRAAFSTGEITTDAAALIGQTLQHAPDSLEVLLAAARRSQHELTETCIKARAETEDPIQRRQRQHAARSLHFRNDSDGMIYGKFRLTPEVGGQVKAVVDAGVQRKFREHRANGEHEPHVAYAADTLAELILEHAAEQQPARPNDHDPSPNEARDPSAADGHDSRPTIEDASSGDETSSDPPIAGEPAAAASRRARRHGRSRVHASVHVVIDHAALIRGDALAGETCEIPGVGPVDVEWVRGLLGDAFLTAIIRDGTDIRTVAHFGRHINAKLRTALLVQGRECDIAGCHRRGYLEIDHTHDHARGGPTSLANLGWLCSHHHALKTRGWTLSRPDPVTSKRSLAPPARARAPAAS